MFGCEHSIDGPKHRADRASFQGTELKSLEIHGFLFLDLYSCFNLEKSNTLIRNPYLIIFKKFL